MAQCIRCGEAKSSSRSARGTRRVAGGRCDERWGVWGAANALGSSCGARWLLCWRIHHAPSWTTRRDDGETMRRAESAVAASGSRIGSSDWASGGSGSGIRSSDLVTGGSGSGMSRQRSALGVWRSLSFPTRGRHGLESPCCFLAAMAWEAGGSGHIAHALR